MQYNKICILGGSGFVGTHLIAQLGAAGKTIKVLTRRKERSKHLAVIPDIEIVEANIHDQHVLNEQLKGMDAVINLVGILNEKEHNGDGFRYVHVELPRKILNACHENKISRLLHMSALNADANSSPSRYLRSKGEGENQLHSFAGKINVTSFRPSVIYGRHDSFFNRFAGLLKLIPVFPLACADTRFAPVYVGDVTRRFVDALDDPATFGQRYDLCGPKEYTLKELVEYAGTSLGLKRKVIALPDLISQVLAIWMEWWPGKPFSIDNFQTLQVDSVNKEATPEATTVESVVPYYLGQQQRTELKDQYRRLANR